MVVLPLVPVTPTTVSASDGWPQNASAIGPIASRTERASSWGSGVSIDPLHEERGGARPSAAVGREVVAVDVARRGRSRTARPG